MLACPAGLISFHKRVALNTDTITAIFLSEWVSVACQRNQKLKWDFVGPVTLDVWLEPLSFTGWSAAVVQYIQSNCMMRPRPNVV